MTWEILNKENELHIRRKFNPSVTPIGRITTYGERTRADGEDHYKNTYDVVAIIMPIYKKIPLQNVRNRGINKKEVEWVTEPNTTAAEAILRCLEAVNS